MRQTKEQLKKKAAALRLALRKTAAAAEEVRLRHEEAEREAAQLEEDAERLEERLQYENAAAAQEEAALVEVDRVAAAIESIRQRTLMDEELEQKVLEAPHESFWERFKNAFKGMG
jgi:hypothetical protein